MGKRKTDDFIASEDDEIDEEEDNESVAESSEEEQKPKSRKKAKTKARQESDDEDEKPLKKPKITKEKSVKTVKSSPRKTLQSASGIKTSSDGEKYLELGKKKRATVRSFKGTSMLDIREFYEKDGKELPGKKGISINEEQWAKIKDNADAIDSMFAELK
ncbi:hypothetical protein HWV62_31361 [Athelia sp. TMB]|nr:hypothetical protein HWV62_31361 [Athelia sp. TMB]